MSNKVELIMDMNTRVANAHYKRIGFTPSNYKFISS
jgi:hypothetical protein